ncbi:MAG: AgmX/PglI C-terminal domain-containing protein [Pseudomonadota bacterium]|nr:AgmX/PglI C-terminal domain-containing protein [Pseudomonadota bacterium]
MLEIPGEEAPTDPGIHARERKDQEDKAKLAKKQRKNRVLGALGLVVLFGLSGTGVWAYQTQQQALTYEMDDYYATPLSELQTASAPAVPGSAAAGIPGAVAGVKNPGTNGLRPNGRKNPELAPIGSGNPGAGSGPARPNYQAGADAAAPAINSASGGATGDLGVGQIKVGFVGSDKVLTDNDEIFAMAKAVINASSPQLQGCYNQRLKAVEGLKGAWEVSFTIGKNGVAKSVSVTGVNGSDRELESCMDRQVSGWKFQKIVKDQPVKKTYRFGAGSW